MGLRVGDSHKFASPTDQQPGSVIDNLAAVRQLLAIAGDHLASLIEDGGAILYYPEAVTRWPHQSEGSMRRTYGAAACSVQSSLGFLSQVGSSGPNKEQAATRRAMTETAVMALRERISCTQS